eukprot:m.72135 g.72135  ORF g.72135 m.72135 type:complete len:498 (-) comp14233_c0_seq4:36-1529(-)
MMSDVAENAAAATPADVAPAAGTKEDKAARKQRMREMRQQKQNEIVEEHREAQRKREAKAGGQVLAEAQAEAVDLASLKLTKEQELALVEKRLKELEMQATLEKAVPGQSAAEIMNGAANAEFEDRVVEFSQDRWGMNARLTGGPVVITGVKEGGEGAQKGVLVGDVIYRIGGVAVDEDREAALALVRKGGATTVQFKRLAARAPVPVGTKSEGHTAIKGEDLSQNEVARMQAMLGGAKAKDTVAHTGQKGVTVNINDESLPSSSTLVISGCEDSTFTVDVMCAKVFLQGCKNVTLHANARILTATVEAYKCEGVTCNLATKIGTVQADLCKDLSVNFPKQEFFCDQNSKSGKNTSMIVWAGCHNLQLTIADVDHTLSTGFEQMKLEYADLVEERSQFRIKYKENTAGDFILEQTKIIRLENGFFTTQQEKNEFDLKQEANMQQMAKAMGLQVQKAKPKGIKCKPNDMCPQGSGKKFKRCCNKLDGYCTGQGANAEW